MDNFNLKNYLKENVLNEGMLDNALDALYERLQNMAGEDLDDFLAFYAPDIDNRDANAITDWVYGLSEDDAQTILSDLQDYDELGGLNENEDELSDTDKKYLTDITEKFVEDNISADDAKKKNALEFIQQLLIKME